MLRPLLAAALMAALGLSAANAQELPSFAKLDANSDGAVTMAETQLLFYSTFERHDVDKSGALDAAEFAAAEAQLKRREAKGRAFAPDMPPPANRRELKAALDRFVAHHELEGAALIVGSTRGRRISLYAGDYRPDTVRNIASASKWFLGMMSASVVAETDLEFTSTVASWRPALATKPIGAATFEQLLSFTAGAPGLAEGGGLDIAQPVDGALVPLAEKLAANELAAAPGTRFAYGSWSQQVAAGWAAEVTGESWQALFERTIARPLGLKDSVWGGLWPAPGPDGVANPVVQGGLWTSPRDMAKFVEAVAQEGRYRGKTVFPAAVVKSLERDLIADKAKAQGTDGGRMSGFGVGIWCEGEKRPDGTCPRVSSPGAWGAYNWVDREKGVWGVFLVRDRSNRTTPDFYVLRDAAEAMLAPPHKERVP
jgi:CubicO group peptidase (beta-lactamase class C family)